MTRQEYEKDFPQMKYEMRLYAMEVMSDLGRKCFDDKPLIEIIKESLS